MRTQAATVKAYIAGQPADRQPALNQLREVIVNSLPPGFEEVMLYDMITYVVPYRLYPKGYHVKPHPPLPFISLANQQHFLALYHLGIYSDPQLLAKLKIGKLDMGKSCIRFKKVDQIPWQLIGELCTRISVDQYIANYEAQINGKI
jgi:Domain of unknown function (DU1801)